MNSKSKSSLLLSFLLSISSFCFLSCSEEDDGYRGFMQNATITGDQINGYYCYLDRGGLVISHDQNLEGIERGYFAFNYIEDDWKIMNDAMYIDKAHVVPYTVYNVILPINIEEAESQHITDKDSCSIPKLFKVTYGYRGYLNLSMGLSIVNMINLEKFPIKTNLVYDPAKQTSDTLKLQLCYNLRIPEKWSKTSIDYGSISCDISSFATLRQWSDSVTVVIETGDEQNDWTKISKNDFLKPDFKIAP